MNKIIQDDAKDSKGKKSQCMKYYIWMYHRGHIHIWSFFLLLKAYVVLALWIILVRLPSFYFSYFPKLNAFSQIRKVLFFFTNQQISISYSDRRKKLINNFFFVCTKCVFLSDTKAMEEVIILQFPQIKMSMNQAFCSPQI